MEPDVCHPQQRLELLDGIGGATPEAEATPFGARRELAAIEGRAAIEDRSRLREDDVGEEGAEVFEPLRHRCGDGRGVGAAEIESASFDDDAAHAGAVGFIATADGAASFAHVRKLDRGGAVGQVLGGTSARLRS
jgi:hypothetical protein